MKTDRAVNLSMEVVNHLSELKQNVKESYDSVLRRVFEMKPREVPYFETKYPIAHLELGEETVLPWERDPDTSVAYNAKSMGDCVRQHERKTGKHFWMHGSPDGLIVRRVR